MASCHYTLSMKHSGCQLDDGCQQSDGDAGADSDATPAAQALSETVRKLLKDDGVELKDDEFRSLIRQLRSSSRKRRNLSESRRSKDGMPPDDILRLTLEAKELGQRDEAFWRAFLAAHFGQSPQEKWGSGLPDSASRLLNAFGSSPVWTWETVKSLDHRLSRNGSTTMPTILERFRLATTGSTNQKTRSNLWDVLSPFVKIESAAAFFDLPLNDGDPFDVLYHRLRKLHQFGRTGSFDFLTLLADLGLIDVHPLKLLSSGFHWTVEGLRSFGVNAQWANWILLQLSSRKG